MLNTDLLPMTPPRALSATADDAFAHRLESFGGAPDWFLDLRRRAWERFQERPLPRRKDEPWRYATVSALDPEPFHLPTPPTDVDEEALLEKARIVSRHAGRMAFTDDRLHHVEPISDELAAQGVIWKPLRQAVYEDADLLQEFLFKDCPELGSEKFEDLHLALFNNGSFLYVPDNIEIAAPLVSAHWCLGEDVALFPHTLIATGANAKVSMVDIFRSTESAGNSYVVGSAQVYAGAGAKVFYNAVEEWNLQTTAFHLNSVTAQRDSHVKTVTVNLGGRQLRNEQHTRIVGAGANVENYSLNVATGDQEFDQRTLQTHSAPHARSDLLYKNVLQGDSRTIFSGLIRVDENAQQTDAYQTNRNLLLSDTAEANSLPGLEILANDVKCSHGATTGQLDENNLFYFLARGIPREKAQQLLVFGFFEEIIGKIDHDELRENVRRHIHRKFLS